MHRARSNSAAAASTILAGLWLVWAGLGTPAVAQEAQREPVVAKAPPSTDVCPAIGDDHALCLLDPKSGSCQDFVVAAEALRLLYPYKIQHDLLQPADVQNTVWWGCGSKKLWEFADLLQRIG
jgi:hypothetical protein